MTPDEILRAFDNIRVWQRGDRPAPHKPLLILMAQGRLQRGVKPRVEFAEIEGKLGRLLEEFGPSGSSASRHLPFWHLATDGLWQLHGPAEITARPPRATSPSGRGWRAARAREDMETSYPHLIILEAAWKLDSRRLPVLETCFAINVKLTLAIFTSLIIWALQRINAFIERGRFRCSMAEGPSSCGTGRT